MAKSHLPLNALRAFEASARHLSFTKAGMELRVGQAAISHQVKALEARLGVELFRRRPRGLALTDEGQALIPAIAESFSRVRATLERFEKGHFRGVVSVGVVGTFATRWLLPRLNSFRQAHPFVDLRIQTNNNRVDLAGEGLDFAIRYGNGSWRNTEAIPLLAVALSPVCAPQIAERITAPADLAEEALSRSYHADEWPRWFAAAGVTCPAIRGSLSHDGRGGGVVWSSRSTSRYRSAVIGSRRSSRRRPTRCGRFVCGSRRRLQIFGHELRGGVERHQSAGFHAASRPLAVSMAARRSRTLAQSRCACCANSNRVSWVKLSSHPVPRGSNRTVTRSKLSESFSPTSA